MAKIEELIPFVLYFEVGLTKSELALPVPQMFAAATKKGFANDPIDRGGATMCGVILDTYRTYRKSKGILTTTVNDLKKMSYEDWRRIVNAKSMLMIRKLIMWFHYHKQKRICRRCIYSNSQNKSMCKICCDE